MALKLQVSELIVPKSIETTLKSGRNICLRAIRADDEENIDEGIRELSDQSRYLRFFSGFKEAPPSVVERLAAADGSDHIAWGMIDMDHPDQKAFAAAHAIRESSDDRFGEFSIAVLDEYQAQGSGRILMTTVFLRCLMEDIDMLDIQTLHENKKAKALVKSVGAELVKTEGSIAFYCLNISSALALLYDKHNAPGIQSVFQAFGTR
ncbi:MAG: GNAT family N-acetyltransferase [Parasphingorhabdus sp.]|uniref:GNAT family N-acetyltransferase n=1 Tax=Parasphingorhabdus sp. TaxID=2709688 RepID=UPI003001C4DA